MSRRFQAFEYNYIKQHFVLAGKCQKAENCLFIGAHSCFSLDHNAPKHDGLIEYDAFLPNSV